MNCLTKRCIKTLLILSILFSAATTWADVKKVTVSPVSRNVPIGSSTTISLVWTVGRIDLTQQNLPAVTTSSQGVFRTSSGGTILGTVSKTLSKSVPHLTLTSFSETVIVVPRSVVFKAYKLGLSSLIYQRTFDDGSGSDSGSITLNITGSGSSMFNINRVSLRFDDDSPVRRVFRKESLHAMADISFSGTGPVKGVWEVADPSSAVGSPVYRPLRIVRQQLTAGRKITLTGPELPTEKVGIHLVRFRITAPETGFDTPVIRYFVAKETPDTPKPPAPMRLLAPGPGSELTPEIDFNWQAMEGARAYQLELYLRESTPISSQPVTGMLVPAEQIKTSLSQMAQQRLSDGKVYLWRVVAIGEDGSIIGESQFREIRIVGPTD